MVVSKAVLVPELQRADVWVMTRSDQDWFDDANRRFGGIRVFSREAAEERADDFTNSERCYWFEPAEPDLFAVPPPPAGRAIRYGATVTAGVPCNSPTALAPTKSCSAARTCPGTRTSMAK